MHQSFIITIIIIDNLLCKLSTSVVQYILSIKTIINTGRNSTQYHVDAAQGYCFSQSYYFDFRYLRINY